MPLELSITPDGYMMPYTTHVRSTSYQRWNHALESYFCTFFFLPSIDGRSLLDTVNTIARVYCVEGSQPYNLSLNPAPFSASGREDREFSRVDPESSGETPPF